MIITYVEELELIIEARTTMSHAEFGAALRSAVARNKGSKLRVVDYKLVIDDKSRAKELMLEAARRGGVVSCAKTDKLFYLQGGANLSSDELTYGNLDIYNKSKFEQIGVNDLLHILRGHTVAKNTASHGQARMRFFVQDVFADGHIRLRSGETVKIDVTNTEDIKNFVANKAAHGVLKKALGRKPEPEDYVEMGAVAQEMLTRRKLENAEAKTGPGPYSEIHKEDN